MQVKNPDLAPAPVVGLAEHYGPGRVAEHTHRRAQVMFAVSGSMTVLTDAGSWVLPANRALLIPGMCPHALDVRRNLELRTLYLDETAGFVPRLSAPAVVAVSALIRELIAALCQEPWNYGPESAAFRLAHVLCDRLLPETREPVHLPEPSDPRIRRLARIYLENPAERRPISEVARQSGASLRTVERLFRQETGLSVGEWIIQRRLMRAMELISDGIAIGEAAFRVGFENPSSFTAAFRQRFQVSPREYFA